MKPKNIPTTELLFDDVLKDFVSFEDDKILLVEIIPKELALFFLDYNACLYSYYSYS